MKLQYKIQENKTALFNSFLSLSDSQLTCIPNEKSWSILQCLEHIFLVDVGISKILSTNPNIEIETNIKTQLYGEEKLHLLLLNRSYKVSAPEFVNPKGRFTSKENAIQNITIIIDKIIHHLSVQDISNETQTFKHPFLGEMTKTDWIHFLIHHTNRHILQIEELKVILGFKTT